MKNSDAWPTPDKIKTTYDPGLVLDVDNEMHFDATRMLAGLGIPITQANVEALEAEFKAQCRAHNAKAPIVDVFH